MYLLVPRVEDALQDAARATGIEQPNQGVDRGAQAKFGLEVDHPLQRRHPGRQRQEGGLAAVEQGADVLPIHGRLQT